MRKKKKKKKKNALYGVHKTPTGILGKRGIELLFSMRDVVCMCECGCVEKANLEDLMNRKEEEKERKRENQECRGEIVREMSFGFLSAKLLSISYGSEHGLYLRQEDFTMTGR